MATPVTKKAVPAKAETTQVSGVVKVRNISGRVLHLSLGTLLVDGEGEATLAEVSVLADYITKV